MRPKSRRQGLRHSGAMQRLQAGAAPCHFPAPPEATEVRTFRRRPAPRHHRLSTVNMRARVARAKREPSLVRDAKGGCIAAGDYGAWGHIVGGKHSRDVWVRIGGRKTIPCVLTGPVVSLGPTRSHSPLARERPHSMFALDFLDLDVLMAPLPLLSWKWERGKQF